MLRIETEGRCFRTILSNSYRYRTVHAEQPSHPWNGAGPKDWLSQKNLIATCSPVRPLHITRWQVACMNGQTQRMEDNTKGTELNWPLVGGSQ
jgi:hypothetical protein